MGFRDIECFNQALLAKLAWRLIKEPQSLLGQILFGKYCISAPFLDCHCPSSASHGWRGIIWGRDLLQRGLGWSVGNGAQIEVWSDPWISLSEPITPIGPPPSLESKRLMVSDLILPDSNEWNLEVIRHHLPLYEDSILQLIPSSFNKQDELVWLPETSGEYSVKSGYAIARKSQQNMMDPTFPWRKCIWNLHTPPKIQSFLWRSVNGALPVGHTLRVRGLHAEAKCKRCGEIETPVHLFLKCPFAARVWETVPAMYKPSIDTEFTMRELLVNNSRMVNLPPTGLGRSPIYPWLYWHLWKNRNRLVFEGKSCTVQELILKALTDARNWEEATQMEKRTSPPPSAYVLPFPPCYLALDAIRMEHGTLSLVTVDKAGLLLIPPVLLSGTNLVTAFTWLRLLWRKH